VTPETDAIRDEKGKGKDIPETSNVIETNTTKNDGSLKEENISGEYTPLVDVPNFERIMPAKEKSSKKKKKHEMKKAKEIYDREASIHSGASNIQENLGKSESILDDSQKILKNKLVRNILDEDEKKGSSADSATLEKAEVSHISSIHGC